jgi:hypothetical protein
LRREASRQFSKNMASHLAFEAARALAHGQYTRARRCAFAALRLHPLGLTRRALDGFAKKSSAAEAGRT